MNSIRQITLSRMIRLMRTILILTAILSLSPAASFNTALAQSKAKKYELGWQITSMTLLPPSLQGYQSPAASEPGFGARITYNFTDQLAVESEVNFFPNRNVFSVPDQGRAVQGQFGLKFGKRFKRIGVFGKVRPGFLSIDNVFFYEPGARFDFQGVILLNVRNDRQTHFTTDLGGALEFYPSGRTVFRVDAGDTVVRYGPSFEPIAFDPLNQTKVPAKIKHNFQLTAGFALRFKDSEATASSVSVAPKHRDPVPRFEAGVHFTSLSLQQTGFVCPEICLFGAAIPDTEPGFGGRFTFNATPNIAFEAEGNFFPRPPNITGGGGHLIQTQFGGKFGKRWQRFGIFGKLRPGAFGFTDSLKLKGTQQFFIFGRTVEFGLFRKEWRSYPSLNVGGVLEFYVSRRLMTRLDLGDTIVHYGEYAIAGLLLSRLIVRRAPETHHNFQFSAGVGWRFK
jgi:hypothetical protein